MNSIIPAIIAMFGVIIGTIIAKDGERRKTLIEIKQKVFSEWWSEFYVIQKEASDIYYSKPKNKLDLEDDIKIGDLFQPMSIRESIVFMYLNLEDANRFLKLNATLRYCYCISADETYKRNSIGPAIDEIRMIFHNSLRENYFGFISSAVFNFAKTIYRNLRRKNYELK